MRARYRRSEPGGDPSRQPRARAHDRAHGRGTGMRIALRIAARTSLKSLGRSVLIATMVAVPVSGLAAVALVEQSRIPTAEETATVALGQTEARITMVSAPDDAIIQEPTEPDRWGMFEPNRDFESEPASGDILDPSVLLPTGTRILELRRTSVIATTATGIGNLDAVEGPAWDPSFSGQFDVLEGRAPHNADEVMVTAATLTRLGVTLGGTVELRSPTSRDVTVVGVLDAQAYPDSAQMIFGAPGAFPQNSSDTATTAQLDQQTYYYLPDTQLDWSEVQELNKSGAVVLSRQVLLDPPAPGSYPSMFPPDIGALLGFLSIVLIGAAFAVFEVSLLAGAAFTVTARQQQRMLATMASIGADRSLLARVVSANGIVLGAAGAVLGLALGISGGAVFMAVTADGSSTRYPGFHLSWPIMAAIACFAVLVGWIAALAPARSASRFDVVAALRGSRRPPRPSRRRPILGLGLLIGGIALTLAARVVKVAMLENGQWQGGDPRAFVLPTTATFAGPIIAILGLALCAPLLLRLLAAAGGRAGIGARLALRDAARNPGRSVPALAAIMSTVFVAVFAMAMISSDAEARDGYYSYQYAPGQAAVWLTQWDSEAQQNRMLADPADIEATIKANLDIREVRTLQRSTDLTPAEYEAAVNDSSSGTDPLTTITIDVPTANLCPNQPGSPDYIANPNPAELMKDWRCPNTPSFTGSDIWSGTNVWVGDESDLALILDRQPSRAAEEALRSGGAVSFHREFLSGSTLSISRWLARDAVAQEPGNGAAPLERTTLDAVLEKTAHSIGFGIFITPETANEIGLDYGDALVLASPASPPTEAQLDAASEAFVTLTGLPGIDPLQLETGPDDTSGPWTSALLGLTALITIASSAIAIGLARVDGRADEATLSSVGGSRLLRRSFAFWGALVISGTGAVLGAALGLLPAFAYATPGTGGPFEPPWMHIALTAVALPLAVAIGSWLLVARHRPIGRRVTIA